MGGLRRSIPWTFWTMTFGVLAIAGIPGLSGFFSKDEILWEAWSSEHGSRLLWLVGLVTALMTSFYMFRLWFLTFFGRYRGALSQDEHAGRERHAGSAALDTHAPAHGHRGIHESPYIMVVPLAILAVLSVIGGYVGIPHVLGGGNQFHSFLAPVIQKVEAAPVETGEHAATAAEQPSHVEPHAEGGYAESGAELALMGASVAVALLGLLFAWLLYHRRPELPQRIAASAGGLYGAVSNKWYVDELYGALFVNPLVEGSTRFLWRGIDVGAIDNTINESAHGAGDVSRAVRRMQSGNLRSYAGWVALGAALVIAFMIWKGTR